ncbi:gluconokinase [Siccirubricoccus deserti]
MTPLVVVMGVSGSGKSTIGPLLATALGVDFADADAFHPAANVAKMSRGQPLTDADRWPWLDAIGAWLDAGRRRRRRHLLGAEAQLPRPAAGWTAGGAAAAPERRGGADHGEAGGAGRPFHAAEPDGQPIRRAGAAGAGGGAITLSVAATPEAILAAALEALATG